MGVRRLVVANGPNIFQMLLVLEVAFLKVLFYDLFCFCCTLMTLSIFSGLSVSCKLYADDVKLYSSYSVNMTNQDLSVAIDHLLSWSSKWQLKIANEKCPVLRISNHRCISSCMHPTYTLCLKKRR